MTHYIDIEVKAADDRGGWRAVANTASIDRDNERILPYSMSWATPTLPVHCNHEMRVEQLVGRCTPSYDAKGRLMVDGVFGTTPLAQSCRAAVVDGSLDSMSIAFIKAVKAKGKDGVTEIQSGSLVSVDFVTIPSNVDARVLTARGHASGPTVAQARRLVQATMRDLLRLDIAEAERVLGLKHGGAASRFVRKQLRS